jgi:hypothetical protein
MSKKFFMKINGLVEYDGLMTGLRPAPGAVPRLVEFQGLAGWNDRLHERA